jgi:spermidine synthase
VASRRLLVVLYTASGAAALVYEVVWTRMLALQLGHTVAAASTVLAAFMGGLAAGAWIGGRVVTAKTAGDGVANPMRVYAALEIVIAASALVLPFALHATTPVLAWAYADGTAPVRFAAVRVIVSLALLGVPAMAMGATYPIAAAWLARAAGPASRSAQPDSHAKAGAMSAAGMLYAANTAGAAVGAIAAGFWLIPALGLRGSTWVGVALNVLAAGGALWLPRRAAATTMNAKTAEHAEKAKVRSQKSETKGTAYKRKESFPRPLRSIVVTPTPRLATVAVAISGFAALAYEVAWTRLLALVIGPTTYAFATMAAAFITGLAIGSAIGTPLSRRVARPAVWMAALLVVGGVASVAAAWFAANRLPLRVAAQVADPNVVFSRVILGEAFTVALLLLPTTVALGATFPLALAAASLPSNIAPAAARVYTANTLGAIAGALAAGFVLIPQLGVRTTFLVAALTAAIGGAACTALLIRGARSRVIAAAATVAAIVAIVSIPEWDRALLASGAYKYAPYIQPADLDTVLHAGTLEYYKEGATGTVSVRALPGARTLAIDGKVDASNSGDMLTQRMLGLLPVLIHGRARDIAVIGLGSGVTVGSALAPGTVEHADVIEISPEVVAASRLFDTESGTPLADPRVRLIVGDGRSHLLLTPRQYDVIVSEPSNPWMAGVASLFTREFFEAARARLHPGGLLCQWAHTYDISPADLQSIVRTFASVFPRGTMWLVGEGDLLLIGANGGDIDEKLAAIAEGCRKGTTAAMLATLGIREAAAPFTVLSLYAGGARELARYGGETPIQTDDRMALEYSAPRGIYGLAANDNTAAIRALAPADPPPAIRAAFTAATDASWVSRGAMLLKAEAFGLAFEAFRKAAELNSPNADALAGLVDAAAGAHREAEARDWLTALAAREANNAPVRVALARVLAAAGQLEAAADMATAALRIEPGDAAAGEQLASIFADAGDAERLTAIADQLAARFPNRPDPAYYRATALFMRGRTEDALAIVQPVAAAHPDHARAHNLLGAACATLDRRECAERAFEASIRANPHDDATYVNFGTFQLQHANVDAALRTFADALAVNPQSDAARNGLAQARAARVTRR